MKSIFYIVLVLLVFSTSSFSQPDTTVLKYYPLEIGNAWAYNVYEYDIYPDEYYYSIEVIGDTILSNNKAYKIIKKDEIFPPYNPRYYFERVDTLTGNVYQYSSSAVNKEIFLDSLASNIGETSKAARIIAGHYANYGSTLTDTSTVAVIGSWTKSKRFDILDASNEHYHVLAEGVGLLKGYSKIGYSTKEIKLVFAKIGDRLYGNNIGVEPEKPNEIIVTAELYDNYPNPFNPSTTIDFYLNKSSEVKLQIYSVDGRLVENITSGNLNAGKHSYKWNAENYASGIYIYQLTVNRQVLQKQCVLLK